MCFLFSWLKQRRKCIFFFLLSFLILACMFALYHFPLTAVLYPFLLCGLIGTIFAASDLYRTRKIHRQLMQQAQMPAESTAFPPAQTIIEADYQAVLSRLEAQMKALSAETDARYTNMMDYYTVWVHQIKTPIASMRLTLSGEDSSLSRRLLEDLQRIEQYVEMVLAFLRLDSDSTDYVIRACDLDPMIRAALKKLRLQFISRRLSLSYEPLQFSVVTDEKWFSFVLEQLLSNALKYTPAGTIRISMETPGVLCICDTGIGIAPEDLPRIFEKGYTGYNGRTDKAASGLGLYLCKQVCDRLGHPISVESVPNRGTIVRIDLHRDKCIVE